ncbi:NUDIX hydrolase [Rubrivirga litoralis]|uniref:NUDIX domain-containing protein n=1 Tax=Rubrivirga litoralis TaxID=3075598 RepID=A0ABU3BM17_9BACT|nr:NUDIX domain-containing protein [Rubrivirga sp. F394]MDT0630323.1 NUDIX domain-containing protein [Rubrivirga sp. F394]
MLLFLPTFDRSHDPVPPEGWRSPGEPYRLYTTLDAAEAAATSPDGHTGRVLVLDPARLGPGAQAAPPAVAEVPRAAVLNVDPDGDYWRPAPVAAGGGYVVRRAEGGAGGAGGVELLLIFRRGAWDLPKGKLDDGETVREAAHREVSEEVGVKKKKLTVTADLGETVHGYVWPKREVYAVKTTRWFAMTTTAERFEPETREGIEAVAWVPWAEAAERVGFETLRAHHAGLDPTALGV